MTLKSITKFKILKISKEYPILTFISKLISLEDLDALEPLLGDYENTLEKVPSISLKNQIFQGLSKKIIEAFALFDPKDRAIGLIITRRAKSDVNHGYIHLLHVYNTYKNSDVECKLFDAAFASLKPCHSINLEFSVSDILTNHMLKLGFQKIDRSEMVIGRSAIKSLNKPSLPSKYSIVTWDSEMISSIAQLVASINSKTLDGVLFPFLAEITRCEAFILEIMNHPNVKSLSQHTRLLKHLDELIGVCFIAIRSDKIGIIPEFGISTTYQRKGLGRALITHSLLELFASISELEEVFLAVTLSNIGALKLYETLGFRHFRKFSIFILRR